ncbi:hypothetical protein MHBO_000728 [Bonamia ostreae]|uniref:R3H domain-containing protein n=1 Tax=Bonamia ostreae TaxID=126728 RepID=A0ABV2AGL8_9EUKA
MSLLDEASKAAIERYLEIAESSKYRTGKANQKSVGMTEFVSKEVPGMKFEVKQKCRDFLVQEIPRSKAPLVLKNCQLPQTECDFYRLKRKRKFERTNYPTKEIACIEAEKILRELLPQKEKNSVLAFLKEADKEEAALKIEKKLNKEDRKLVHQMISKNFSLFDSETVNGEAESSLKNIKVLQ